MVKERLSRALKASNYEEALKRRIASRRKILLTLAKAIPHLATARRDNDLTADERAECSYALVRTKDIKAHMAKRNDWPTVKILEFVDRDSPEYDKQWTAFRFAKLRTLGVFLNRDVEEVKLAFTRQGTRLPKVLEILHREYWGRTETV
jgi:hypothetical protein